MKSLSRKKRYQPYIPDYSDPYLHFPLVWIIISSLKGKGELTGNPTAVLA